jgi:peptidoglycan/xylan/chitin deacetylase (PgdA/CDA1 family)
MMVCPQLPVLLYHSIGPGRLPTRTSPERFLSHMRYLSAQGYKTLTCAEYEAWARGDGDPRAKAVLITFDDGVASQFTHALPILERFGQHAVTFVITHKLGDGPPRYADDQSACGTEEAYLRWHEIAHMVASGAYEVQSHGHKHVRWDALHPDIADRARVLEADLVASRALLMERVGSIDLGHLAWPWGRSTDEMRALARRHGFRFQYTVKYDFNTPATPLDQINRLLMDGKSLVAFVAILEFFRASLLSRVYSPLRRRYDRMKGGVAETK